MTKQDIKDLVAVMDSASRLLGNNSLIARVTRLSLIVNSDGGLDLVDYEELAELRTVLVGELFTHQNATGRLLNKLVNL